METKKVNVNKTAFKKVTVAKKSVKLLWKKVSKVKGYQIQYSINKKFTKATTIWVKKSSTTKYTIKKLKKSTNYYVRIRSYKVVKGKKYYSIWSKKKSVKTKK